MTKESRLLLLSVLTLIIYAVIGLIQHGSVVFPFPINDFLFFIVVTQFTVWHYNKGTLTFTMFLAGLFGLLSNKTFWEIYMSIERLQDFLNYPWVLWFGLFNTICIIIGTVYLIRGQKSHYTSIITTTGIILFGAGFHTQIQLLSLLGFSLIGLALLLRPVYKPLHLLWFLLLILELSELLTYFLA